MLTDEQILQKATLLLEKISENSLIKSEFTLNEITDAEKRVVLDVLRRIYENPSTLTYEASIRTGLLKDYYITMSNIDRSEYYNIKFQKKPFMMWIWISVIFISLGGFLRFFKNAKKYN